jgi:hypothetical protein
MVIVGVFEGEGVPGIESSPQPGAATRPASIAEAVNKRNRMVLFSRSGCDLFNHSEQDEYHRE